MDELITLVSDSEQRDLVASLRSIGQSEFYQAHAVGYKPELKFVLADYLDYNGEDLVKHDGKLYRVLRTFRNGLELEIIVGSASAEEVALYG